VYYFADESVNVILAQSKLSVNVMK